MTPYADPRRAPRSICGAWPIRSFCPVYLRAATAYGVSPLLRFDLSVNNLVAWAATTGRVFLKSLGTSWRPLVHIEDIAQAYVALLRAPEEKVHNRAFNIGQTEENYRISDVAELVRQIVPDTRIEFAADASRGPAQLPGQLRPDPAHVAALPAALDGGRRASEEVYDAIRRCRAQQRRFRGPALQPDRLSEAAAGRRPGRRGPALGGAARAAAA